MQFYEKHKFACFATLIVVISIIIAFSLLRATDFPLSRETEAPNNVTIQAQIETDGSLNVVDQRTFMFTENEALCWEISRTTKYSETTISAVRAIVEGEQGTQVLMPEKSQTKDGPNNKWYFDEESNQFQVRLSPVLIGKKVVVEVSYIQRNAVYVYDDVAELYWEYLPAENAANGNVTAQVLIPNSSEVEVINNKTSWGWGHGAQGSIEFVEVGGYLFASTLSGAATNSDAHIIFPSSCLVNFDKNSATNVGGARKNSAISEEAKWTDEWSVQQGNAALMNAWECAVAFCVTFMAAIAYAGLLRKYKRILGDDVSLKQQLDFDEKCLKFQKRMFILSFTLLIISLFLLFYMKNIGGGIAFLMSFVVCFLQSNWTPSVHSNFRDRIKG